jgi:hypothetical protein
MSKYKQLTDVEHVLLRPEMYIGAINEQKSMEYVFNTETNSIKKEEVSFVPALDQPVAILEFSSNAAIVQRLRWDEIFDELSVFSLDNSTI